MATREHKGRKFCSAILTAQNILLFDALANSKPSLTCAQANNTTMSGRSASISVASDAMVCVECFRMKGDQDLKAPCQNPRCYFYLQVPGCDPNSPHPNSMSPGPLFKKEVGCDCSTAMGRAAVKSRPSHSSDLLMSSQSERSSKSGNSIWAFAPDNKAHLSQQQQPSKQMRSQSISNTPPSVNYKRLNISQNKVSSNNNAMLSEAERVKLMRKRMMSMPLVAGMESLMDSSESDLLVEDAFLSSPLPEFTTVATERALNPGSVGQKMVSS